MVMIVCVFRTSNQCTLQAKKISVHLHGIKKSAVNRPLSTLVVNILRNSELVYQ